MEFEPLIPHYTQDARDARTVQLPADSCSRSARWKRSIKFGGLLTFGVALLTTTFGLVPHYFWSSYKHFGPAEPHDYAVQVCSRFWFRGPAGELSSTDGLIDIFFTAG